MQNEHEIYGNKRSKSKPNHYSEFLLALGGNRN